MHISEKVAAELISQGFTFNGADYRKSVATGGSFGSTLAIVRMDATGRWLERVDGWNDLIREIDLRNYREGAAAIAAVLS